MKKILFLTIIIVTLVKCKANLCFKEIDGKYLNTRNDTVCELYLYKDKTYLCKLYTNNLVLENKGNWIIDKESPCTLIMKNWKDYNDLGSGYQEYANYLLVIDGDNLNNSFDGVIESSFHKIKDNK